MPLFNTEKDWDDYVAAAEIVARSPGFLQLRDAILERAEVAAGERVLDIGSGTGLLTLPSAAVAERVWALDISGGMCNYLDVKVRSAGFTNVEPVVASAASIPLVDECVEVVVSNYCFHHLDPAGKVTALAEVHRTLVPGGRLVFGDMMFSMALGEARNRRVVADKVGSMLAKGPAGAWRLARNGTRYVTGRWESPATPEWWRTALVSAGFEDVEVETLPHEGGIGSGRKATTAR